MIPELNERAGAALRGLAEYVEGEGYAGYDPYDALNSPLIRGGCLGWKWARIGWIQAFRRCPVNLRPLFLTRKGHNPKALGLFLEGYARLGKAGHEVGTLARVEQLLELIRVNRTETAHGYGWGYNFDWQSRAFYVPRGTPTIVNSGFVGHALLDVAEAGLPCSGRALEMAKPVAGFILDDLNRIEEGGAFCFSYTPLDRYAVHNANLLGASFLIRLWSKSAEPRFKEAARAALDYSMRHQRDDGSWYYSERDGSRWIDSFHTGFNLESIRRFLRAGVAEEWRGGYERGKEFYQNRFFLADGTPKYYHDQVYPIDIHSPAEAICYFSDEGDGSRELVERILTWTLDHLYDDRGFFYFRRTRHLVNRIPYMRWGQAWAFRALAGYMASLQRISCQ